LGERFWYLDGFGGDLYLFLFFLQIVLWHRTPNVLLGGEVADKYFCRLVPIKLVIFLSAVENDRILTLKRGPHDHRGEEIVWRQQMLTHEIGVTNVPVTGIRSHWSEMVGAALL